MVLIKHRGKATTAGGANSRRKCDVGAGGKVHHPTY